MKKLKNILSGIKNFFSKVHSKLPKIPPMKPETRGGTFEGEWRSGDFRRGKNRGHGLPRI